MKPTIHWCAFCKHWRGGYTPKCQFCEMYDVTVPPDKFEAEHIGVSNRQADKLYMYCPKCGAQMDEVMKK